MDWVKLKSDKDDENLPQISGYYICQLSCGVVCIGYFCRIDKARFGNFWSFRAVVENFCTMNHIPPVVVAWQHLPDPLTKEEIVAVCNGHSAYADNPDKIPPYIPEKINS